MNFVISILLLSCAAVQPLLQADHIFDTRLEAPFLQNIKQVTSRNMGFEKAGEAYFSPSGKSIIFQAVKIGETNYQMYVMSLKDLKPRMVSTGRGACTCGYFRPDGKKIIFASSHSDPSLANANYEQPAPGYKREGSNYVWEFTPFMNIYEANPDGSELKPLTTGPFYTAECAYSSNGKQIVFASNRSGSMNIYTMDADGTNIRQITNTRNCYNGGPFFSPSGNQIVFRADRDRKDYLQIYTIQADGTLEKQITHNGAVNWAPYWHPNGQVIAFTTSLHGHVSYEIYLVQTTTGKTHRLTHNASFDGLPTFSKNGKKIVWTSKRNGNQGCQLFVADFKLPY